MFLVKANTNIQIYAPLGDPAPAGKNGDRGWFDWNPWKPYTTKEDKLYDKHEVLDLIAVYNDREMPEWARRNIMEHGKTVLVRNGKYALVNPKDIEFLD